jgi:hypothetical protein
MSFAPYQKLILQKEGGRQSAMVSHVEQMMGGTAMIADAAECSLNSNIIATIWTYAYALKMISIRLPTLRPAKKAFRTPFL